MTAHPTRTAALLLVLAAVALLLAAPPPAEATPEAGQLRYRGEGSHTRVVFDTGPQEVGLPDIRDAGAGALRFRLAFESTTIARTRATAELQSTAGPLQAGQPVDVAVRHTAARDSGGPLGIGLPELGVVARPTLHLVYDYVPEDAAPFTCTPLEWDPAAPEPTPGPGAHPEERCGRIEVTAAMLDPLVEEDVDALFQLVAEGYHPLYVGSRTIGDTRELFQVPVCMLLTAHVTGIPFLGDRCRIRVDGTATATQVVAAQGGGFAGTGQLATDLQLPDGTVVAGGLPVGEPAALRWAAAGSAATHSAAVPCVPGMPLYHRLTDNRHVSRVQDVGLTFALHFNVDRVVGDGTRDLFQIRQTQTADLLDGGSIPVTATAMPHLQPLGTVGEDTTPPTVGVGGPHAVDEGSTLRLQAVGTGPAGQVDGCDPTGEDTAFRWELGDGTTATGRDVEMRVRDQLPALPGGGNARLIATDPAGNTAIVPFTIAVREIPAALVTTSPADGAVVEAGRAITFTATSADPGADVHTFGWAFGDGATAAITTDGRSATARHTYDQVCVCTVTATVSDGAARVPDTRDSALVVIDRAARLHSSAVFTADDASTGIRPGQEYRIRATDVRYDERSTAPTGRVEVSADGFRLTGTDLAWLVGRRDGTAVLQGDAVVEGSREPWRFRATVVRDATGRETTATVVAWRPGTTTLAQPDYAFGGPMARGVADIRL